MKIQSPMQAIHCNQLNCITESNGILYLYAYPSLLAKLMEKSLREFKLSEIFGDDGPPLDMALVLLMLV